MITPKARLEQLRDALAESLSVDERTELLREINAIEADALAAVAEATREFRDANAAADAWNRGGPHGIPQARVKLNGTGDRVSVNWQAGASSTVLGQAEAYKLAQDLLKASEIALRVDRTRVALYVASRAV